MRSRASTTDTSASPVKVKPGRPAERSASTSTTCPSTPDRASARVRAITIRARAKVPDRGGAPRLAQYRDHVEAQLRPVTWIAVRLLLGEPAHRQPSQPRRLGAEHRLGRIAVRRRRAGLHLAEDENRPVSGDQVELAVNATPVAREDGQPGIDEVLLGDSLAVLPDGILGAHASTVPAALGRITVLEKVVDNHGTCGRPT